MKKFLLTAVIILAVPPLVVFILWLLDIKTNYLSKAVSSTLRQTLGYCIDGRQIYLKNRPFVVGSNGACLVCICTPEFDGVSCQYNKEIVDCE